MKKFIIPILCLLLSSSLLVITLTAGSNSRVIDAQAAAQCWEEIAPYLPAATHQYTSTQCLMDVGCDDEDWSNVGYEQTWTYHPTQSCWTAITCTNPNEPYYCCLQVNP